MAPAPVRSVARWRGRVFRRVTLARHRRDFDGLERYVTFVGHPRNSSTLLGALLDAHPDAVVCHELGALRRVDEARREQFLQLHLDRSRWFVEEMGGQWSGYDYSVPGGWQGGRYRRLRVVGDKRARLAAVQLGSDPELVDRLGALVRVPLAFVHVVRDPLDNVATIVRKQRDSTPAADQVERFFARCDTIARLRDERMDTFVEVHQEDLVADPRTVLAGVASALELVPEPEWLEAASGLVFASVPHTSRSIDWPAGVEDDVRRRMTDYDWFHRYAR